jgi:hypothetical protein
LATFPPTAPSNYRVFKNYRVLQGGPKNLQKTHLKTKSCEDFFVAGRHRFSAKAPPFQRKLAREAPPFQRG